MNRQRHDAAGFTITDLVAVLSVIALLLALALPVVGRLRSTSGVEVSLDNLVYLGVAHALYAADWDGRQFTTSRDDFGQFGNNLQEYLASQGSYVIPLGWSQGTLWIFSIGGCSPCFEPIVFQGPAPGFGSFRLYNFATGFHEYVNGRTYDPIFFAPNDTALFEFVQEAFADPDELVLIDDVPAAHAPSYALSPAAMFSPEVMRAPSAGGWQNPWSLANGFESPPLDGAAFPDLKTHMIEHNWAQNPPADCNPAFPDGTPCRPYLFNHGIDSAPATLFYDGHTRLLPNTEVFAADQQILEQTGGVDGLWSRDTPFGTSGYFIDVGYDGVPLSHHILTTDGILGRDTLGPAPPIARWAGKGKDSRYHWGFLVAPDPVIAQFERAQP